MNNRAILEALASDLKRVSLGLQRGSFSMAKRFGEEALARKQELDEATLEPYIIKVLDSTEQVLRTQLTGERTAEDALMYSTILQNFVQKLE